MSTSGIGVPRPAVSDFLTPLGFLQFSFFAAAILCLLYAIALPIIFYVETQKILLSDVYIYYFLTAIGLYLTERVLVMCEGVRS